MDSDKASGLIRTILVEIGPKQVQAWVSRFVSSVLEVDRWKYGDHWAVVTRCWSNAINGWARGEDLASVGTWIRKGDEAYDAWCKQVGPRVPWYDDLRTFALELIAEYVRQRAGL